MHIIRKVIFVSFKCHGESPNIVEAVKFARESGLMVISFQGEGLGIAFLKLPIFPYGWTVMHTTLLKIPIVAGY